MLNGAPRPPARLRRLDQIVSGGGGAPLYGYHGEPDLRQYRMDSGRDSARVRHLAKPGVDPGENVYQSTCFYLDSAHPPSVRSAWFRFNRKRIDDALPRGAHMIDDMGIFRTSIEVAAHGHPNDRRRLDDVMVDSGSEFNWVPRDILEELGVAPVYVEQFETADGRVIEREVGFALLYAAGRVTGTTVVFAEPGDKVLLGAIGLEGLNVRIDLARKQLVPAGPVSVASTTADLADVPAGRA